MSNIYKFQHSAKLYDRVLRQLDQNKEESQDNYCQYYQYKLENPKNQIRTRSIYTEEESQCFVSHANKQQEADLDIRKFIQNSKTLKQKIYEKLQKKKKKKSYNKITETTFRPNPVQQTRLKQNTKINNLSNRKSLNKQEIFRKKVKTEKKRFVTEIDEANALWDKKDEKNLSELDFYERQQKTLTHRKQFTERLKNEKKQKEMEGCTFRPKLTTYKPKRS